MPVLCLRLVQSFVNFATNSAHHRLHSITAPDLLKSCLPLISVLGGPKKQFWVGWFWVGPCRKRSRMPQPSFKSNGALKAWRSNIRLSILEAGNMIPGLRHAWVPHTMPFKMYSALACVHCVVSALVGFLLLASQPARGDALSPRSPGGLRSTYYRMIHMEIAPPPYSLRP